MNAPRVALVHERFTEIAGSEHVVEQLAVQWPEAKVHVPIARPSGTPSTLRTRTDTTWLDRLYHLSGERSYAPLLPFMSRSFRSMDLGCADIVLVSHHAFASQAVFATAAPTIAYVHSPARWAWEASLREGESGGRVGGAVLEQLAASARRAELAAAPRLYRVVANSTTVADRIRRWWRRDAVVVHPPVDTEAFTPDPRVPRENFFLVAGRLVPYKRPDLAILAANAAGVRLVVVGDGRSLDHCRRIAGETVTFLGRVPHTQLVDMYRRCRALVMPGLEDFGIVPVEAMACGTPVIALGAGGVLDTVVPGVTGVHVSGSADTELVDNFAAALKEFDRRDYDPVAIRERAESFSRKVFRDRMQRLVDDVPT
ncbi:glycosyltransferase [Rhodococcus pyridinivorans]|uniref:glycosyltransferase n=1 Tax=Rhodococcus pyridinivorans TaxID=103816 RepID=UPI002078EC77|nr:glycosyltransferase [Rhodococcus pyridinivorans]USI92500.1 glycosyltransferase [Rhodococcus pyridinivorans]